MHKHFQVADGYFIGVNCSEIDLACLSQTFSAALRTLPHTYILHFLLHLKFVKRVDLTCVLITVEKKELSSLFDAPKVMSLFNILANSV